MITSRLEDLRQDRAARRAFARGILDSLVCEEFYATSRRDLELVIRGAKREDSLYARLVGEPMPSHLRAALTTEVLTWMWLYDVLVRAPVGEDAYASLCDGLRPRVLNLLDLLAVEQEMLSNPLVRHYELWLREYRSRAPQ